MQQAEQLSAYSVRFCLIHTSKTECAASFVSAFASEVRAPWALLPVCSSQCRPVQHPRQAVVHLVNPAVTVIVEQRSIFVSRRKTKHPPRVTWSFPSLFDFCCWRLAPGDVDGPQADGLKIVGFVGRRVGFVLRARDHTQVGSEGGRLYW